MGPGVVLTHISIQNRNRPTQQDICCRLSHKQWACPSLAPGGLGGNQTSNLGSADVTLHSLSCTMQDRTVLIKQEVVATLYQLAYLTLSIVHLSQQSKWVKPPVMTPPARPLVPAAASGAGTGLGGKMIGEKKRCRSAQTRHLFKNPVRSESGAHLPSTAVASRGYRQGADLREPVKGDVTEKVTVRSTRKKEKKL